MSRPKKDMLDYRESEQLYAHNPNVNFDICKA